MAEYLTCDLGVIFGINFCIVQQWEKLGNWNDAWFVAQFSDYLIKVLFSHLKIEILD